MKEKSLQVVASWIAPQALWQPEDEVQAQAEMVVAAQATSLGACGQIWSPGQVLNWQVAAPKLQPATSAQRASSCGQVDGSHSQVFVLQPPGAIKQPISINHDAPPNALRKATSRPRLQSTPGRSYGHARVG